MPRDSRSDSASASAGSPVAACTATSACREAIPLPETLNFAEAGPLLCGGVTVFAPLARFAKPTDRVGIIGIGGLGHMAVKFAAAYGCDVTAFTSSGSKFDEAKGFGANHVVCSKDSAE